MSEAYRRIYGLLNKILAVAHEKRWALSSTQIEAPTVDVFTIGHHRPRAEPALGLIRMVGKVGSVPSPSTSCPDVSQ